MYFSLFWRRLEAASLVFARNRDIRKSRNVSRDRVITNELAQMKTCHSVSWLQPRSVENTTAQQPQLPNRKIITSIKWFNRNINNGQLLKLWHWNNQQITFKLLELPYIETSVRALSLNGETWMWMQLFENTRGWKTLLVIVARVLKEQTYFNRFKRFGGTIN